MLTFRKCPVCGGTLRRKVILKNQEVNTYYFVCDNDGYSEELDDHSYERNQEEEQQG